MQNRSLSDSSEILQRVDKLMNTASNRYKMTTKVANRAKCCRSENFDALDDPKMKPVIQAIIEMSDELTAPELISEFDQLST